MRLISFLFVVLSLQPAFGKSPEYGLELWLFKPKSTVPNVDDSRVRGGETYRWGPFIADLGDITERSRAYGLHFDDDTLTIDSFQSELGLSSFIGKTPMPFKDFFILYRIYNVGFVAHSRHPFKFRAPDRLDVRITPEGRVDFRDRGAVVGYLQSQVDTVLSDATWDANFNYFYRGLPKYAMYLGDKVFQAKRARILEMAREQTKSRFGEPQFLDRFLTQIAASMPPLQSKEFEGFDAAVERQGSAWRFRPSLFESDFSPAVKASIAPTIGAGEANRATLVVRAEAARALFGNFLAALERGSPDVPPLPAGLSRHAKQPALVYDIPAEQESGLKNFFADYAAGLDSAHYRYGVFIGGAEKPSMAICRNQRNEAFLDLKASFLLEANNGDRTIPLVLRFKLDGASTSLALVNLRKPGEEPRALLDVKSFEAIAAKLKFLVLQSLVNQRLDETLHFAKGALKPVIEIKGLRTLGTTSGKCDSQMFEAEAIALDFALAQ